MSCVLYAYHFINHIYPFGFRYFILSMFLIFYLCFCLYFQFYSFCFSRFHTQLHFNNGFSSFISVYSVLLFFRCNVLRVSCLKKMSQFINLKGRVTKTFSFCWFFQIPEPGAASGYLRKITRTQTRGPFSTLPRHRSRELCQKQRNLDMNLQLTGCCHWVGVGTLLHDTQPSPFYLFLIITAITFVFEVIFQIPVFCFGSIQFKGIEMCLYDFFLLPVHNSLSSSILFTGIFIVFIIRPFVPHLCIFLCWNLLASDSFLSQ